MSNITVIKAGGSDTNIMNADLIAPADRSQDMNGKVMSFTNGKQFKWLNNVAPAIGEGSFDLQGYGTSVSDVVWRVKNGAGQESLVLYGNKSFYNYGNFYSYQVNHMETIRSPYFPTCGLLIQNGLEHNSRGEIGSAYVSHKFKSENLITSAGSKVAEFLNFTTLHLDIDKDGNVGMYNLPTYADNATASAAIGVGKLYKRTGHGLDITV